MPHLPSLGAAIATYIAALIPVTLVAVIFFENAPDAIIVPLEYLIPLWPAAVVYRRNRPTRPAPSPATTLCLTCGYDLRATPARCPECGTAVVSTTPLEPGRS